MAPPPPRRPAPPPAPPPPPRGSRVRWRRRGPRRRPLLLLFFFFAVPAFAARPPRRRRRCAPARERQRVRRLLAHAYADSTLDARRSPTIAERVGDGERPAPWRRRGTRDARRRREKACYAFVSVFRSRFGPATRRPGRDGIVHRVRFASAARRRRRPSSGRRTRAPRRRRPPPPPFFRHARRPTRQTRRIRSVRRGVRPFVRPFGVGVVARRARASNAWLAPSRRRSARSGVESIVGPYETVISSPRRRAADANRAVRSASKTAWDDRGG